LHIRSAKNRFLAALRDPKFIAKTLGLVFFLAIIVISTLGSALVEVSISDVLLNKGLIFLVFLLPYGAGRFGGSGSFGMNDVNFVFTAPIMPRTVLLSGIIRRLGGLLLLAFSAMAIVAVVVMISPAAAIIALPRVSDVLIVGLFALVLTVVCTLFGMYLFVAYKKVYRWIGLFWMGMLAGVFVFYWLGANMDAVYGLTGLLESPLFALTPLVGWATAGAFSLMTGEVLWGLLYFGLLLAAGGYFFKVIYRSNPDFYEDTLGGSAVADVAATSVVATEAAVATTPTMTTTHTMSATSFERATAYVNTTSGTASSYEVSTPLHDESTSQATSLLGESYDHSQLPLHNESKPEHSHPLLSRIIANKHGAAAFFHRHIWEQARSKWGIFNTEDLWLIAFAIVWGLYTRGFGADFEVIAVLFILIGVPSGNILAVLAVLVFVTAIAPRFDRGFKEFSSPYFYLVPDSPLRKIIWASMGAVINISVTAVLVFGLAGVISGTHVGLVLLAALAYLLAAFMVLGTRAASSWVFGLATGAGRKLAATLPVIFFVLIGWVGLVALFFMGPGLYVALAAFCGWCLLIGTVGFLIAVRGLHNVDAPV